MSRVSWGALRRVTAADEAVVLLTSGSEALPKAVPLTHVNLLTNLRDVLATLTIREDDRLIGFLPPFHSFGLMATCVLPLLTGVSVVYHADPTEAWVLARLIEAYGATILVGTPTFLAGIVRASSAGQLASLRLAITGAERCPQRTYASLSAACPDAVVVEGYGITECSPIVSANSPDDPHPFTIGRMMPSVEHVLVDVDSLRAVGPNETGLLLVRGPSVFSGYLGQTAESPFVEFDGRQWYRTGDLVSESADGVLTFRGRLKRFVKLGGEMISLPAIEAVLGEHFLSADDEGPVIAVESTPNEDHPEIVLFTTRATDRPTVNRQIREADLSALHNISRVIAIDEIPVLGTGKTDYRALKERLRET
ncbi:MAG: AMP-binding protein [Planctomycetes bacterium]|nr:AMP-binding protein [Planctomycetota bacterium]